MRSTILSSEAASSSPENTIMIAVISIFFEKIDPDC